MIILLDLDGTLADWNLWLDKHADELYPHMRGRIPRAVEARSFDLFAGLDTDASAALLALFDHPGFYRDIPPIEGAVTAVHEMLEAGHQIFFVSSPWFTNPTCMQDKVDWVRRYFGEWAADRLILTKDKTAVRGDILIDDKPKVSGLHAPEWKHILFHQSYNEDLDRERIRDWSEWRSVVTRVTDMLDRVS